MSKNQFQVQRESLHTVLSSLAGIRGVYFQPPSSEKMKYPCVSYDYDSESILNADNKPYISWPKYTVEIIDRDPESSLPKMLETIHPRCIVKFDRKFTHDNLNHWMFTLVFEGTEKIELKEE